MLKIKKTDITDWEHANLPDFEIDLEKIAQEKLALVSDIPLEDLRHIKQRYRTGDLYDSFGRVLFRKEKNSALRLDGDATIFGVDYQ